MTPDARSLRASLLQMQRLGTIENFLATLTPEQTEALNHDWQVWARDDQLAPASEWFLWLILAGRGWGKTRTGAEFIRGRVESGVGRRIALVARTAADARDVMVEGESGILACAPSYFRPIYEPSKRRLTWPNGAIATTYSADEGSQLRGPQHDTAWADEPAAWDDRDAFDQMLFGLRLGQDPRAVLTTTPRNRPLVRELVEDARKRATAANKIRVHVTRGRTLDNAANLAPTFLSTVVAKYAGTRLGRQELDGDLLTDTPGALWSAAMFTPGETACVLVSEPPMQFARIIVGVDPPAGGDHEAAAEAAADGESDDPRAECGIIAAGKGADDGLGYVLADRSMRGKPEEWARAVVKLAQDVKADAIACEINQGGDMVESTLRTIPDAKQFRIVKVRAYRGKIVRAEPVSSLYEQRKVRHVATEYLPDDDGVWQAQPKSVDRLSHLAKLEDQLTTYVPGKKSPDRMDAAVYALAELMILDRIGYSVIR